MTIAPKYNGFADREDVARNFYEGIGDRFGEDFKPARNFPSERNILYASYENGGYDGWAWVLFRKGTQLFEVNWSHCSCFGLEGQWKPEKTSWAALAIRTPDGAPREVITEAKRRVARRKAETNEHRHGHHLRRLSHPRRAGTAALSRQAPVKKHHGEKD